MKNVTVSCFKFNVKFPFEVKKEALDNLMKDFEKSLNQEIQIKYPGVKVGETEIRSQTVVDI